MLSKCWDVPGGWWSGEMNEKMPSLWWETVYTWILPLLKWTLAKRRMLSTLRSLVKMNTAGATDSLGHTISTLKKHGFLCFLIFQIRPVVILKFFLICLNALVAVLECNIVYKYEIYFFSWVVIRFLLPDL
jgi:hypothetical protein